MRLQIGITGASGYLGSRLCSGLTAAGHDVISLVRSPREQDRQFVLGEAISPQDLKDLDVLIHCAWDMRLSKPSEVADTNVEGSRKLLEAAQRAGVPRVIFISSMSAYPGCRSAYGRAKLEVERLVRQQGGISIRPGLIYGKDPGGITGTLLKLARRLPVLPMIGRGHYILHTCHEDDLSALVEKVCSAQHAQLPEIVTAAEATGRRFSDIIRTLAGRNLRFIPVPWRLAWFGLRSLEALRLRPPMKSDSVIGLVYSNPAPDFSGLDQLDCVFRDLRRPSDEA